MEREKFVEAFASFIPYLFKKVMRGLQVGGISKMQLELLFKISSENGKPMSYYSERMVIPKSNLTVLSDKLIKEGYVERIYDRNDRRIIILSITKKGEEILTEHRNMVKKAILKKLEGISDQDIQRLNVLIKEMKEILGKIEQ